MSYDPNQGGGEQWQQPQQPGDQPPSAPQPQQPGYQQPGYQQPGYQQPGYQQPQYQQPQYQQPGYQQPYAAAGPKTDGMAIASLATGIAGILFCWCFGILLSIAALVLGILSRKKISESNGQIGGDGIALAGLITGGIGVLLGLLGIIWAFSGNAYYYRY